MANTLKNYEKKYTQLEEIVRQLDEEELPLHTMLDQYKKGLTLVKECSQMLQQTEEEVQQLVEEIRITDSTTLK